MYIDSILDANMLSHVFVWMLISIWNPNFAWIQFSNYTYLKWYKHCKFKFQYSVCQFNIYRKCAGCIRHCSPHTVAIYILIYIYIKVLCSCLDSKIMWHLLQKVHVNICSCISSFMWLPCLWEQCNEFSNIKATGLRYAFTFNNIYNQFSLLYGGFSRFNNFLIGFYLFLLICTIQFFIFGWFTWNLALNGIYFEFGREKKKKTLT